MPWSRELNQGRAQTVSVQLQYLGQHLQMYLERVWEGDPLQFLTHVRTELEQLRRQLEHRKADLRTLAKATQKITELTLEYHESIRLSPDRLTPETLARLMRHATSIEQISGLVSQIESTLRIDLQMAEDVDNLARMVRESDLKRQRDEERGKGLPGGRGGEEPVGWRSSLGHFHLVDNWYSSPAVMNLAPKFSHEKCSCAGKCQPFRCERHLDGEECEPTENDCGNQRFQRHKEKVQVRQTADRGAGTFATKRHSKGALVMEYRGEVVTRSTMQIRVDALGVRALEYTMDLDTSSRAPNKQLILDATHYGSTARFTNHRCDGGNCHVERWRVNGRWCMGLFASRDIEENEEITYDYLGGRPTGPSTFTCVCGSPNCRSIRQVVEGATARPDSSQDPSQALHDEAHGDGQDEIMAETQGSEHGSVDRIEGEVLMAEVLLGERSEDGSSQEDPPLPTGHPGESWVRNHLHTEWDAWRWPSLLLPLRTHVLEHVYNMLLVWITRNHATVDGWVDILAAVMDLEAGVTPTSSGTALSHPGIIRDEARATQYVESLVEILPPYRPLDSELFVRGIDGVWPPAAIHQLRKWIPENQIGCDWHVLRQQAQILWRKHSQETTMLTQREQIMDWLRARHRRLAMTVWPSLQVLLPDDHRAVLREWLGSHPRANAHDMMEFVSDMPMGADIPQPRGPRWPFIHARFEASHQERGDYGRLAVPRVMADVRTAVTPGTFEMIRDWVLQNSPFIPDWGTIGRALEYVCVHGRPPTHLRGASKRKMMVTVGEAMSAGAGELYSLQLLGLLRPQPPEDAAVKLYLSALGGVWPEGALEDLTKWAMGGHAEEHADRSWEEIHQRAMSHLEGGELDPSPHSVPPTPEQQGGPRPQVIAHATAVTPAVSHFRLATLSTWQRVLDTHGANTPAERTAFWDELREGQRNGEWTPMIEALQHTAETREDIARGLVHYAGAPLIVGNDFRGTASEATATFGSGPHCTREEHDELDRSLQLMGYVADNVPRGASAIWHAALPVDSPYDWAELRERVTRSILQEGHSSPRRRQEYNAALGGDMEEYVGQVRSGLSTAFIHPLCIYHLSKVLERGVEVWMPHIAWPTMYLWNEALQDARTLPVAWVHRTQHGTLNHFWRVAEPQQLGGTRELGPRSPAVLAETDSPVEPPRHSPPPDGGNWQWERRKDPVWGTLLQRIVEQHPADAEVCRTIDTPLPRSGLRHYTLSETDRRGTQRRRTDDSGLTSLSSRIWLRDDIIWHILTQWARRQGYGYGTTRPSPHARAIWIGDTFTYGTDIQIPSRARRERIPRLQGIDLANLEALVLPVNLDNAHWITVVAWIRKGQIQIIDSLGGEHSRIARKVSKWLQEIQAAQGLPVTRWRMEYSATSRQRNGVDCGVFMISDILSVLEPGQKRMAQRGIERQRKWLVQLLWSAGHLHVQANGAVRGVNEGPPEREASLWEDDLTTIEFLPIPEDEEATESEGESDDDDGGRGREVVDLNTPEEGGAQERREAPPDPNEAERRARAARGPPGGHGDCKQSSLFDNGVLGEETERLQMQVDDAAGRREEAKWIDAWEQSEPWTHDTRRLGSRPVTIHGDWEMGGAWWGGISGYVTWNVGPLGWEKSTEDLLQILLTNPTVVTLQDVRVGKKGIKSIRRWAKAFAPQYLPFLDTRCVRKLNPETGRMQRYWYGVITLIHKEARPALQPKRLRDEGLSAEDAEHAAGRVLLNTIPGLGKRDKSTLIINVYQYQAVEPEHQARLLDILERYITRVRRRHKTVILSGDLNAALEGLRWGYVGDYERVDSQLQGFRRRLAFRDGDGTMQHTWAPYNGRDQAAVLDYVWLLTDEKQGEHQLGTRHPPQERHDHRVVTGTFSSNLLPMVQTEDETKAQPRLNMRKYPDFEPALQDHLTELVAKWEQEEGDRDDVQLTDDLLAEAGRWLAAAIGSDSPPRRGEEKFQSPELRTMTAQMKALQRARHHLLQCLHGGAGAALKRGLINKALGIVEEWEGWAPWAMEDLEHVKTTIVDTRQRILREHTKTMDRMKREQIESFKATCRARLKRPGAKEIARFLGKRAARLDLWGLLPRSQDRWYPSTLRVKGQGWREDVMQVLDPGMEASLTAACHQPVTEWVTLLNTRTGERMRLRNNGDGSKSIQVFPLVRLTTVIQQITGNGHGAEILDLSIAEEEVPWTRATDKLAQAEYYYAVESTDDLRRCVNCDSCVEQMVPLSTETSHGVRGQEWYCRHCQEFHAHYLGAVPDDDAIRELCAQRPFSPLPFLGREIQWEDFEFYIHHLPRHKSAGGDGVPYEVIRGASLPVRQLIHRCLNRLLTGAAIPRTWAKGLVRLLEKREPVYQLENLRPVTLLRTIYKLHTGVVNNRVQWELEENGILEPTQDGFRPGRQTRKAVARLQYFLEESRRGGQEVYVCFVDWFSAFCSVPHSRLFQMLEWSGMHPNDVEIIRRLQEHAQLQVVTDFGATCEVPITRGTPQGDTLSPTLFSLFINICLRGLAKTGVGFEHACGVRTNACAFADDIALMTNTITDMNTLLDSLRSFSKWSGMRMNLKKCEVTGFCFRSNRERRTEAIRFGGEPLTPLRGKDAFKYLGVRVAANGCTKSERIYVREATTAISKLSRHHPYHPYQMEDILRTAVRPIFLYSAPLTAWSHRHLDDLERGWARVHKNCWGLTTGHHSAPFQVGQSEGGVSDMSIYTLRAKECMGLLSKLARHEDGDMLKLFRQEYEWLQTDWGTPDPWQLQLCLMLGDTPEMYPTMLSQAMIALGHVGLTMKWNSVPMPFIDPEVDEGVLTLLESKLWQDIQNHWITGEGEQQLRQLAVALRALAARNLTQVEQLRREGGWYLEPHWMPRAAAEALMEALEATGAGPRCSVHSMLRSQVIQEEDRIELVIGERERVGGVRPPRWRPNEPDRFEGLGEISGQILHHRLNAGGELEYQVEIKTSSGGTPTVLRHMAELEGRTILIQHGFHPVNQPEWPARSPTGLGWWARVIRTYLDNRQWRVELQYLDHNVRGLSDVLSARKLIPTLRAHEALPTTIPAWLRQEQFGDTRMAVGSGLPRAIQTYWEEVRRRGSPIPASIQTAMAQRASRLQRDGREWAQEGLPFVLPPAAPPDTWERDDHHRRQRGLELDPTTCILHMNGQPTRRHVVPSSTREGLPVQGEIRLVQARAYHFHGDYQAWSGERAKLRQWMERDQMNMETISTVGLEHADHTAAMEEQGYRTLTWQLQRQIQDQLRLDTSVGPSAWEALPSFGTWLPGFDADVIPSHTSPLLLLEAVPEELRLAAVLQAIRCERWAIVAKPTSAHWKDKSFIGDRVYRVLDGAGRRQDILTKNSPKVYSKGWSKSGDKTQRRGGPLVMWSVPGHPTPHLQESGDLPPIPPFPPPPESDEMTYVTHLPSGPHLGNPGYAGWTDGSVRSGAESSGAGVWFREDPTLPALPPISTCIGGEPVIIRGEMGAMVLALRSIPVEQPATLFTDSLSMLWIIRRWLRRDFGYCLDEEQHPDLVLALVTELHRRRLVRTTLVWVPSHAGEPGNETVDVLAKRGVDSGPPELDRTCPDIEFWSPSRELVNFLGWRPATTRWANRHAWTTTAKQLRATSTAISTQSLLKGDRHRHHLGGVLQNRDRALTERSVRRMLQARGFNTPVQAVLSRNSGGRTSALCPFCRRGAETLGHFAMACKEFHDARCRAHNGVAEATIREIHSCIKAVTATDPGRDGRHSLLWYDTPAETIYPELWGTPLGQHRPDGIIIDHWARTIHVLELTRGMEGDEQKWRDKEDTKYAAYHGLLIFLQERHPGYRIHQENLVVGILGSVLETEWNTSLSRCGLGPAEWDKITKQTMRAAVQALDYTLSVRQSAREALGREEAGFSPHPSQLDRPPA